MTNTPALLIGETINVVYCYPVRCQSCGGMACWFVQKDDQRRCLDCHEETGQPFEAKATSCKNIGPLNH